jgi:valyl-tRNA synthetase
MPHVTEEIWSYLPTRETRLVVAPWPELGDEHDADALTRVQDAATIFRRSSVLPKLDGDERRIFDAVVKPDRSSVAGDGNADAERERLRSEIARAEKMLADERFVERAPPTVVDAERAKLERYRRELDAIGD